MVWVRVVKDAAAYLIGLIVLSGFCWAAWTVIRDPAAAAELKQAAWGFMGGVLGFLGGLFKPK